MLIVLDLGTCSVLGQGPPTRRIAISVGSKSVRICTWNGIDPGHAHADYHPAPGSVVSVGDDVPVEVIQGRFAGGWHAYRREGDGCLMAHGDGTICDHTPNRADKPVAQTVQQEKPLPSGAPIKPIEQFRGRPFSEVFTHPRTAKRNAWRLRGSGVFGPAEYSDTGAAVLAACEHLGIAVSHRSSGSPANADEYRLDATFLDGGFHSQTGNYMGGTRGAWVEGRKAVLLLALTLGVRVRPYWRKLHRLEAATLESLTKGEETR